MYFKRTVGYLLAITLFLILCVGSAVAYASLNRQVDYPGTGVYDLTAFVPCTAQGETDGQSIEKLAYEFSTNSTEIKVKNDAQEDVWIYLYDTSDETEREILRLQLPAGKSEKFTNLTQARTYRVGVAASGKAYAITLSD